MSISSATVKLLSWNVNGIRAVTKKGFEDSVMSTASDVVCLQEVRANPSDFSFASVPLLASKYASQLWNPAIKKGYSGTMIMADEKMDWTDYRTGLQAMKCEEGRVQSVDLGFAFLVNVYTPNVGRELARLSYRTQWDSAFTSYLCELQKSKPIIVCGDLNVAHQEIDLARPKANIGSAGFTKEERAGFSSLLSDANLVDSFRFLHGDVLGQYTWWSNMGGARAKNIGWRIDYFLVDRRLAPKLKEAAIHPEIKGSDHCPVSITLSL
jgi:exodeoxyribonuclease-3